MTVAYLSHPLGEADADWGAGRGDNIANAIDWFRFLRLVTRWAICYPAMAYCAADSSLQRPSGITGQVEIMSICDVLILTGGKLNPHMRIELARAHTLRKPMLDLLYLGRVPPWEDRDEIVIEIAKRAQELGL